MTFSVKREILTLLEEPCVTRPVMTTRQKVENETKKTKIKHTTTEDNTFLSKDYQIGGSLYTNDMFNFWTVFQTVG